MTKKKTAQESKPALPPGYLPLPDGSGYSVPREMNSEMRRTGDEEAALNQLLSFTNEYVRQRLVVVAQVKRRFWTQVFDELGVDHSDRDGWTYNSITNAVTRDEKTEDAS